MQFFKKKPPPVIPDLNCPAQECEFTADDRFSLERHIEWKHSDMIKESGVKEKKK